MMHPFSTYLLKSNQENVGYRLSYLLVTMLILLLSIIYLYNKVFVTKKVEKTTL